MSRSDYEEMLAAIVPVTAHKCFIDATAKLYKGHRKISMYELDGYVWNSKHEHWEESDELFIARIKEIIK